ncbi:hypothetical protein AV530_007705 [Patagioenas fasciata monilis]|uniref:Uncharacterized protein n=1 Tax=Patagioenas fasciata monilis TaxID=372326 RepID=A0A1V4JYT1_PATFA|nr:hypothetical protein AV530_007705 [Patagioenas fasciata monilis]
MFRGCSPTDLISTLPKWFTWKCCQSVGVPTCVCGEQRSSTSTASVAGWHRLQEATCSPMTRFQVNLEWLQAWQGSKAVAGGFCCGFPGTAQANSRQQTPGVHSVLVMRSERFAEDSDFQLDKGHSIHF